MEIKMKDGNESGELLKRIFKHHTRLPVNILQPSERRKKYIHISRTLFLIFFRLACQYNNRKEVIKIAFHLVSVVDGKKCA
jgi:hypothetical protein